MREPLTRKYELWLPTKVETAFAFFADVHNLIRITPPWLGLKLLSPDPVKVETGATIDFVFRWMGMAMRWRTLIEHLDAPHSFVDSQVRGPYALWRHEHIFSAHNGGTLMKDKVRYRLPAGVMGDAAHGLLVGRQLDAIFNYRAEKTLSFLTPKPKKTVGHPGPGPGLTSTLGVY